jgi:hypothetical protein
MRDASSPIPLFAPVTTIVLSSRRGSWSVEKVEEG